MRPLPWLLFVLLVVAPGCADESPTSPPDAGNPYDQCTGSADMAILAPYLTDAGTGLSDAMNDLLRGCAQDSCAAEVVGDDLDAAKSCLSTCFATTGIAGLTPGCEECYSEAVICAAEPCAVLCLGTDPDLCAACVIEHCKASRDYCTGL